MSFKIDFVVNPEYERDSVFQVLSYAKELPWKRRARQWNVPLDIAEKIFNRETNAMDEWNQFLMTEYSDTDKLQVLHDVAEKKHIFWNSISSDFSSWIENETEELMDSFTCAIGLHSTTSTHNGTSFTAHFERENFIIGFETILSHTKKYLSKYCADLGIQYSEIWGLSEIMAAFFLQEKELQVLFSDFNESKIDSSANDGWFKGYTMLNSYEKVFYPWFKKRDNFKDFIFKCVEFLKENQIKMERE